jgi:hypothetical protein
VREDDGVTCCELRGKHAKISALPERAARRCGTAALAADALFTGHFGIGFDEHGYFLEPWSPLKGQSSRPQMPYMGKTVISPGHFEPR